MDVAAGYRFGLDPSDFLQGIEHIKGSLSQLDNSLESVVQSMTSGDGNFTGPITQAVTEFDKGFAGMAARSGLVGKELKKVEGQVFSTARALNMDAGQLGENLLSLKKVGLTPQDLGLDSLADLGRVLEVTGWSGEQLGKIFTDMTKGYGFTNEEAKAFLDTLTQQSTALGMGSEVFGSLEGMLQSLDDKYAKTLMSEGPEVVKQALLSMNALAAGMTKTVGGTFQDNLQNAQKLFETLQDEANVLPSMMAGLGGEFGDLASQLGMSLSGGFMEAQDLIKQGANDPLAFAQGIAQMYDEISKQGGPQAQQILMRLRNTVTDQLGSSFEYLFEAGGNAVATLKQMRETPKGGIKSLQELGKAGYRTGRTLDESLQMIKEGFAETWKSIGYGGAAKYIERQRKAYADMGKTVKELAGGKGIPYLNGLMGKLGVSEENQKNTNKFLGDLTQAFSLFESDGLGAALEPFLGEKMGGQYGLVISELGDLVGASVPVLTMLGALGFRFSSLLAPIQWLLAPIGTLAGAVATLLGPELALLAVVLGTVVIAVVLFTAAMNGVFGETVQKWTKSIEDGLIKGLIYVMQKLSDFDQWLTTVDFGALGKSLSEKILSGLSGSVDNPQGGVIAGLGSGLLTILQSVFTHAWEGVKAFLVGLDIETLMNAMQDKFSAMLNGVADSFDIGPLMDMMIDAVTKLAIALPYLFGKLQVFMLRADFTAPIAKIFIGILNAIWERAPAILKMLGAVILSGIVLALESGLASVVYLVKTVAMLAANTFMEWFKKTAENIGEYIAPVWEMIFGEGTFANFVSGMVNGWESLKKSISSGYDTFGKVFDVFTTAIEAAYESFQMFWENGLNLDSFVNALKAQVYKIAIALVEAFDLDPQSVGGWVSWIFNGLDNIKATLKGLGAAITEFLSTLDIGKLLSDVGSVLGNVWDSVKPALTKAWDSIQSYVKTKIEEFDFQAIKVSLAKAFDGMVLYASDKLASLLGPGEDFKTKLIAKFYAIKDGVLAQGEEFKAKLIAKFYAIKDGVLAQGEEFKAGLISKFTEIKDAIYGVIGFLFGNTEQEGWFSRAWTTTKETMFALFTDAQAKLGEFKTWVFNTFEYVYTTVYDMFTRAGNLIQTQFQSIAETIDSVWQTIIGYFMEAWDKVKGAFNLASDAVGAIAKMIGISADEPATPEQVNAAALVSKSDLNLINSAGDMKEVVVALFREGNETRKVLRDIEDKIPNIAGPAVSPTKGIAKSGQSSRLP